MKARSRSVAKQVALMAFLTLPVAAHAETIEGKMNGIWCALEGRICPIDKADPFVALEKDFVVQQPDGSFYLIPNIDPAVKARVVLEDVVVKGERYADYNAINAESLQVVRDGELETVWTQRLQDDLQQQLFLRSTDGGG